MIISIFSVALLIKSSNRPVGISRRIERAKDEVGVREIKVRELCLQAQKNDTHENRGEREGFASEIAFSEKRAADKKRQDYA